MKRSKKNYLDQQTKNTNRKINQQIEMKLIDFQITIDWDDFAEVSTVN